MPEREKSIVHVSMGAYMMYTPSVQCSNGRAIWYEQLPEKRVVFPCDVEEIPDIFFYFTDENEEYRRHCFARLKSV